MLLHFFKFNASGSDFILVDNRKWAVELGRHTIEWLCDRRSGVGAAGVVMLEPARIPASGASYRMVQYDPRGNLRASSVHALRCFAEMASALMGEDRSPLLIETREDDVVRAEFVNDMVRLTFAAPDHYSFKVMTIRGLPGSRLCLVESHTTSVSVPVADVRVLNVNELGAAMCMDALLPSASANVHFVQIVKKGVLAVRSYDSCTHAEVPCPGEGILAATLNVLRTENWEGDFRIIITGGEEVIVSYSKNRERGNLETISVLGPAHFVFSGDIEIPEEPVVG